MEDNLPTEETISTFSMGEQIRAGSVRLRDWNFEQPDLKNKGLMEALAPEDNQPHNALEVYEYPGHYANPDSEGKSYAKVRLEELSSLRKVGQGTGTCARFMTGHTFELTRSFRRDFDKSYMLLEVHHSGSGKSGIEDDTGDEGDYSNTFRCIPKDVPFRPARLTPKPAIHGVQTALVVGPEGEEIHTDDRGRVKVKFHWDRSEDMEAPTCWIRVAQIWASPAYGGYFLPRIGQEVIVCFEEGDPDRPLITGCVYYGATPHKLPDEKTRSIIKTNSSPGGEGANVLYFEDKKDSEEVYLHGQKDWTIAIENDKNQTIGNCETLTVESDRTKTVKKDQSETIEGNKNIKVNKDHTEEIAGKMSLSVQKDSTEEVAGQKQVTVTKDYSVSVDGSLSETIKKDRSIVIDGMREETIKKDSKSEAKTIAFEGKDEITLESGKAKITLKKDGTVEISCKDFKVKASGKVEIKASSTAKLEASSDLTLKGGGKVIIKGSQIAEN